MKRLGWMILGAMAICGSAGHTASGQEPPPAVPATTATVTSQADTNRVYMHLPPPIVERILADHEMRGGRVTHPRLLRGFLGMWGPMGIFSRSVTWPGSGEEPNREDPHVLFLNRTLEWGMGGMQKVNISSSGRTRPPQVVPGGYRWRVVYRIALDGHAYDVAIDAETIQADPEGREYASVIVFEGPTRAPNEPLAAPNGEEQD